MEICKVPNNREIPANRSYNESDKTYDINGTKVHGVCNSDLCACSLPHVTAYYDNVFDECTSLIGGKLGGVS